MHLILSPWARPQAGSVSSKSLFYHTIHYYRPWGSVNDTPNPYLLVCSHAARHSPLQHEKHPPTPSHDRWPGKLKIGACVQASVANSTCFFKGRSHDLTGSEERVLTVLLCSFFSSCPLTRGSRTSNVNRTNPSVPTANIAQVAHWLPHFP